VNGVLVAVVVALLAAFAALGVPAGEEDVAAPREPLEDVSARLREIARDVERVRELQFERMPRLRIVSPEEATRDSLREVDHYVSRRRQRIDEGLLAMLGLLPPGVRLREILGEALTEEVAGYYLPRTDTMALLRGTGFGALASEVTLAHELTHAVEHQHFDIEPDEETFFVDDGGFALASLREGSATVAMVDYVALSQGGAVDLGEELRTQVLEQFERIGLPASTGLPRYVRESLVFPYAAGGRFVNRIQSRGGWEAVDRAFEEDPPLSSEQIMHPEKYERGERPVRMRLGGARGELPDGARRLARGDLGEFDTAQFLLRANGRRRAAEAAAGWGGSAFELWRLPGGGDVLVMAWAWDSARDAREFAAAARRSIGPLGAAGVVNGGDEGVVSVVLGPRASLVRGVGLSSAAMR
jgi:hypothetical protein